MNNKLYYNVPATQFIEAQPIGNGILGAMVYGGIKTDKISFNSDTLWSGSCLKPQPKGKEYETYLKVKDLVLDGDSKIEEAENSLIDNFFGEDSQSYMPMCYLTIESSADNYLQYERTLDMEHGVVNVLCKTGDDEIRKQYFISYPDNCFAMSVKSEKPLDYILKLNSELKYSVGINNNIMTISGEAPKSNPYHHKAPKDEMFDGTGIKFTCAFYIASDGELTNNNGLVTVKNACDIKIYSCALTSFTEFNKPADKPTAAAVKNVAEAKEKGYEYLYNRHTEDFSEMFNRTVLDLGADKSAITTDDELKQSNKSLALYEIYFNFGKYLIISGSRDENAQALGLQGIWNERLTPPWNAAYTVNINLEMCYWPMLMCGYTECALPIINQLEKISLTGKAVAENYFNAKGYAGFHNSDIWGFATPPGKYDRTYGCAYGYWSIAAGWLCRHAFEQYEYTESIEVLNRIYPLLKGAAEFFLSILSEYNGKLIVSPSTSPENFYFVGERWSALGIWTTMTQTILIELFTNTVKACEILKCDEALAKQLEEIIPKLYTFKTGSKGQLLEWDKENIETDVHHRHVSHLYGLYPGELFTKEKNSDLYDACKKSLEIRGDNGTGWSLAWKANLWAGLKDGNKALFFIDKLLKFTDFTGFDMDDKGGTYPNLFCAHPPFQIDGNFGVAAAIARLFMQYEDARIKLLPALPDKLKQGRVNGLMAKGNIRTAISWDNGILISCELYSQKDTEVDVEYNGIIKSVKLFANEKQIVTF